MYFLMQVLFDADGAEAGKGTTTYANCDDAEKAYHTALASAIDKPTYSKAVAMVINDDGIVEMSRVWKREV